MNSYQHIRIKFGTKNEISFIHDWHFEVLMFNIEFNIEVETYILLIY